MRKILRVGILGAVILTSAFLVGYKVNEARWDASYRATVASLAHDLTDHSVGSAVKRLSTVEKFAFVGVGYLGVPSSGEIDFTFILSQPQTASSSAFEELYAIGNPQGKLYALSGIKKLDPRRFELLLAASRTATDEVVVMRGCIVSHEALRDVAKQIERGKFRI